MLNIKRSIVIAGLTFIISLLLGLLSGTSFPSLILRPVLFSIIFFGLSVLIPMMIQHFLPELLDIDRETPEVVIPGSRIDITEKTDTTPGVLFAKPDDSEEDMGNIDDISSTSSSSEQEYGAQGLDQDGQNGYTGQGKGFVQDGFDVLPDLDSLAGAFLSTTGEKPAGGQDEKEEYHGHSPARPVIGNKPQALNGDFNPKDLAAGIRTILNKQEG